MAVVHPTAIVDPRAQLAEDARVEAFSVVGPEVALGPGTVVGPHAVVTGRTRVGAGTRIHPFASVGAVPQDLKYRGEPTSLVIGERNVIRENATIHIGTEGGGGVTRIGDDNLIMNGVHIAHDCRVGDHTILASFVALAGHVLVEDYAVLGGYVGVHQFVRIGESVMAAANAKISQDAVPFSLVAGDRARLAGINSVGLRRRGMAPEAIASIKRAFQILFHSKLRLEVAMARVEQEIEDSPEVRRLLDFLRKSERGICR